MTALWATAEVVTAARGRIVGSAPARVGGISIDSRSIRPGDAFVAIKGERLDGHDYVAAALASGAALALVQDGREPEGAEPLLVVPDDPLCALERIAAAARTRMAGHVIAVTGSVGKTGTKEMLRTAFSEIGVTHAPVGSFNNQWGVPLTLARMPASTEYGIFEIGMNHAGEIRPLTRLVRPHVAIVTTVEPVHLAFFESEAAIAEAKAEIFEGLQLGGVAVLNRDNRWFGLLAERAAAQNGRIIGFGEHAAADVRLKRVSLQGDWSEIEADVLGDPVAYRLGAPGRHLVQNSLAVLAAAAALKVDLGRIVDALGGFRAPKGRGERARLRHPRGAFTLIDESYNANPASMRAALSVLGQSAPKGPGRRIAVLGDMLELGEDAPALHRGLAKALDDAKADLVFLAGPLMRNLWQDLPEARRGAYCDGAAALEPILLEAIGPGDIVMVKASLGTKLGGLVEALKRRFGGGDAR
jgi:UDP-N-acetylmuramoyl-tripeptide--D-alanyl-D-alanine ligase